MSYKSKYTGLQIDDLLDSVGGKQNEIEDLDSIRAGAAKGATALQSYTEKYTGTITGVSANGTSIATSGVVNIPAASTSAYGVTKLSSATNSTSTTLAATASAVKAAYDLANGKQDTLVSGTNIKTINGASILGSGDITIEGGGEANVTSDWIENNTSSDSYIKNRTHYVNGTKIDAAGNYSIGLNNSIYYREKVYNLEFGVRTQIDTSAAGVYVTINTAGILNVEDVASLLTAFPIIVISEIVPLNDIFIPEHIVREENIKTINGESILGSGDIVISGSSSSGSGAYAEVNHGTSDTTFTLTPNTFHVWDEVSALTLTLGSETSGVANEYLFQFTSGTTATTLTLPSDLKWANDSAPTIEPNMIYQVSILKGLASVLEFKGKLIRFSIYKVNTEQYYYGEENMTWKDWTNSLYNTNGYSILGSLIVDNTGSYNIASTISTDTIIPNHFYTLELGGGGPV